MLLKKCVECHQVKSVINFRYVRSYGSNWPEKNLSNTISTCELCKSGAERKASKDLAKDQDKIEQLSIRKWV